MRQAVQRFTAVLSNMIHQTSQYTTYKHMRASASESDREPWQTALLIFISFQVWIKHLIMFVPNFKLRHFTPDTPAWVCVYEHDCARQKGQAMSEGMPAVPLQVWFSHNLQTQNKTSQRVTRAQIHTDTRMHINTNASHLRCKRSDKCQKPGCEVEAEEITQR